MPTTRVIFYAEKGICPVLNWLDSLSERIQAKARVRIERLAEMGHALRRPQADYLRDDIYELRWRSQSTNYRILYFFHGRGTVALAHGVTKEAPVRPKDIDLALRRKSAFDASPEEDTYVEE